MRKTQEKLIKRIFKGILNTEVRVLDMSLEEEIDFAIYDELSHKSLSDDTLMKFAWDYAVAKEGDKWMYFIMIHSHGSYDEPPSSDELESTEQYNSFDLALNGLVMHLVQENYGNISEEIYLLEYEG